MLPTTSFFRKNDLPKLINNVICHKNGAQEEFLEAIPLFLEEVGEERCRKELIPFIVSWFDFSDIVIARKLLKIIPLFIRKSQSSIILVDFLYLINEVIRLNPIMLENDTINLCQYLMQIYDNSVFDSYLIPSLDRLYGQESVDAMGLTVTIQALLAADSSPERKRAIIENLLRIAKKDRCYLRMILLKNIKRFCFIAENVNDIIETILIPCFKHDDYKLRARSLSSLESISETFFALYSNVSDIIALGNDPNWKVRYAFARTASKIVEFSPNKDEFGKVLFKLCSDKVCEVKSQALFTLASASKFLSEQILNNIPIIFESCMRTHSEGVRNGAIRLWGALLISHPNAVLHNRLNRSIALMTTVPIPGFIYEMMKYVIPFLPESQLNDEMIDKAVTTLFDTQDRPKLTLNTLEILRLMINTDTLYKYAEPFSQRVRPLLESPVFAVRCQAGYFFVDCTKRFGWDWAKEWFIEETMSLMEDESAPTIISAMRISTALICIEPPEDIANSLREHLVCLTKQTIEVVRANANACLERLNMSS